MSSTIIDVVVRLGAAPLARLGFGTLNILVPQATNSLNGIRYAIYSSLSEATAAQVAGYISQDTLDILTACFAQPNVRRVMLTRADLVGGETYPQALAAAIIAAGSQFYAVAVAVLTDQINEDIGSAVEAASKPMIFFAQSASADLLTSGFPAGLADLDGLERTTITYHDDTDVADAPAACAWAANRLAFNLDVQAPGFMCELKSIPAYATALTTAQADFVVANKANLVRPLGSAPSFLWPAQSASGRGIGDRITGDWLSIRLTEDLEAFILNMSALGRKIPLTSEGQALVASVIEARLQKGVNAGHLVADQASVQYSADDIDTNARSLTFRVVAQIAGEAVTFAVTIDLQTTPVFE
jgi:hypothetical protein